MTLWRLYISDIKNEFGAEITNKKQNVSFFNLFYKFTVAVGEYFIKMSHKLSLQGATFINNIFISE
jgi:hypothetical protein